MTFKQAQVKAYEQAALCKQGSPAHSYWMGIAHAFGNAGAQYDHGSVSPDFFKLPPYIPADKLESK